MLFKTVCPNFTAITVVEFDGEEGKLVSRTLELTNDARHIKGMTAEQYFGN